MIKFSRICTRAALITSVSIFHYIFTTTHAISADISAFSFYESPSAPIKIDNAKVKYSVASAGLESRWSNRFGEVGVRIGAAYNPKESASMTASGRTAELQGPVSGNYGRLDLVARPFEFKGYIPVLAVAHEAFDFHSDELTGTEVLPLLGRTALIASVDGEMQNSMIYLGVRKQFPSLTWIKAEAGYSRWNYSFSATGRGTGEEGGTVLPPPVHASTTSTDPFYRIEFGTEILGQDLSLYYQQRELSSLSKQTLNRFGLNLIFRF